MEQRRNWRRELSENGLLYFIAVVMVSALYLLGRFAHLMGIATASGILVITSLNFIPYLA